METLSKNRIRKHVMLSETTIQYLNEWSQMNELNFSRALEGLALMSIRETRMLGMLEILRETIRVEVAHQYNRFAKLSVHTALEAGAAKEASQHIYWWILLQEFGGYLDDLGADESPTVAGINDVFSIDPETKEGAVLMALFNSRKKRFRYRAVKQLRRPIEEFQDLLAEMEKWAEGLEKDDIETTEWAKHPLVQPSPIGSDDV